MMWETNDRHDTLIYFKSRFCKGLFQQLHFVKVLHDQPGPITATSCRLGQYEIQNNPTMHQKHNYKTFQPKLCKLYTTQAILPKNVQLQARKGFAVKNNLDVHRTQTAN